MVIDRLGGINPLDNLQNAQKAQGSRGGDVADSVSVSAEARRRAEMHFAMDAVRAAPDVRADRVAEVSEKIKDPNYVTKAVIDIVADRFLDELGL